MEGIIKLGSMYLDGVAAECGAAVKDRSLAIGNTHKGFELIWVDVNGLLIADHVVCTNISWIQLDGLGYIFGKPIWIDGKPYLCRSLKVGNSAEVANEWDAALDVEGTDDSLWHWQNTFFWGQEVPTSFASGRTVRGWVSARHWLSSDASYQNIDLGFRPALESLIPGALISDTLIGQSIKVHGPIGELTGILTEVSNYDLFLSPAPDTRPIPNCSWYCQQENGTIAVDRSSVLIANSI